MAEENTNEAPEEPISLEKLSDAFAEMLSEDGDATREDKGSDETGGEASGDDESSAENADDSCPISPQTVVEALLFVGHPENLPLGRDELSNVIHGTEPDEIAEVVEQLNEQYDQQERPYEIVSEGAGYRLVLRDDFQRVRDKFYGRVRQARLSQAAIEVLALVAYNQPLCSDTVSKMRGHPSGSILTQLVRRQLLRIERPQEKPRRPVYLTTERFLQLFGLQSLEDLPRSQEMGP